MNRAHSRREHQPAVVDLFCGVGGLSLGAARAGFDVMAAIDTDTRARAAHSRNFPSSVHFELDLATAPTDCLLHLLDLQEGELDGLIGGPPCQGFSCMGHRRSDDPRNHLFTRYFEIVRNTLPRFFLVENVPGILEPQNRGVLETALGCVADRYSLTGPMVLSAHQYGAPTKRSRMFLLGFRDLTTPVAKDAFAPPANVRSVFVEDALAGLPVKISPDWQTEDEGWRVVARSDRSYFGSRLQGCIPTNVGDPHAISVLRGSRKVSGCLGTRHSEDVVTRYRSIKRGEKDQVSKAQRLDPKGFCPTIRAGTDKDRGSYQAVRPLHPTQDRVITPREAARLQGFPDWFQFDPTKWHSFRQIGNSVSPLLAEAILANVLNLLYERPLSQKGAL